MNSEDKKVYDNIIKKLSHQEYIFFIGGIVKKLVQNGFDFDKFLNYMDQKNIKNIYFFEFIEALINNGQENTVEKNISYFVRCCSSLLQLKGVLSQSNIDLTNINQYINSHFDLIIVEITHYPIYYLKEQKAYDFMSELLKELLEKEQIKLSDIEYLGQGRESTVYGFGSKVLKIGDDRETFNIRDNKRFLKPLYRNKICYLNSNTPLFYIEITEKLDMQHITIDDVYQIYKELRDEGLVWLDPKPANIGRLLRDNNIYFDDIDYVDRESTGYTTSVDDILPKGSLMFADNGNIYDAEEFFKKHDYENFLLYNEFEQRYYREKEEQEKSKKV